MAETINVRDSNYSKSRDRAEKEQRRKQMIEKQLHEELEALDKLLSGLFKEQTIKLNIKL